MGYEYIVPVIKESHRVIKQSNQMKENKSKQIMQSNKENKSKQITKLYEYIVTVIKESHRVIKQSNQMKENKSKQITKLYEYIVQINQIKFMSIKFLYYSQYMIFRCEYRFVWLFHRSCVVRE